MASICRRPRRHRLRLATASRSSPASARLGTCWPAVTMRGPAGPALERSALQQPAVPLAAAAPPEGPAAPQVPAPTVVAVPPDGPARPEGPAPREAPPSSEVPAAPAVPARPEAAVPGPRHAASPAPRHAAPWLRVVVRRVAGARPDAAAWRRVQAWLLGPVAVRSPGRHRTDLARELAPRLLGDPESVTRGIGSVFGSSWCPCPSCACSASIAAFMRLSTDSDRHRFNRLSGTLTSRTWLTPRQRRTGSTVSHWTPSTNARVQAGGTSRCAEYFVADT